MMDRSLARSHDAHPRSDATRFFPRTRYSEREREGGRESSTCCSVPVSHPSNTNQHAHTHNPSRLAAPRGESHRSARPPRRHDRRHPRRPPRPAPARPRLWHGPQRRRRGSLLLRYALPCSRRSMAQGADQRFSRRVGIREYLVSPLLVATLDGPAYVRRRRSPAAAAQVDAVSPAEEISLIRNDRVADSALAGGIAGSSISGLVRTSPRLPLAAQFLLLTYPPLKADAERSRLHSLLRHSSPPHSNTPPTPSASPACKRSSHDDSQPRLPPRHPTTPHPRAAKRRRGSIAYSRRSGNGRPCGN